MSEKQLFSVLVRSIGVLVFMSGLSSLYVTLAQWFESVIPQSLVEAAMAQNVIFFLVALILGAAMVRWPQWVVHLAWLERLPTIGRIKDEETPD